MYNIAHAHNQVCFLALLQIEKCQPKENHWEELVQASANHTAHPSLSQQGFSGILQTLSKSVHSVSTAVHSSGDHNNARALGCGVDPVISDIAVKYTATIALSVTPPQKAAN